MHAIAIRPDASEQARSFDRLTDGGRIGLTPRGHVATMVGHLEEHIAALSQADRAYIVSMLSNLIEEVTA